MAYVSQVWTSPVIRLPHLAMPKPRWPRLSPGVRALLMMGILISPAFTSDYIGYGVMRLFRTAGQIAEMRKPDEAMMARVDIFHVACTDKSMPAEDQRWWTSYAAKNGWPMYPRAGETCFRPERVLVGFAGLKTFNVACPRLALTVADRKRWTDFAADHGWAPYPQAGEDCVDP